MIITNRPIWRWMDGGLNKQILERERGRAVTWRLPSIFSESESFSVTSCCRLAVRRLLNLQTSSDDSHRHLDIEPSFVPSHDLATHAWKIFKAECSPLCSRHNSSDVLEGVAEIYLMGNFQWKYVDIFANFKQISANFQKFGQNLSKFVLKFVHICRKNTPL